MFFFLTAATAAAVASAATALVGGDAVTSHALTASSALPSQPRRFKFAAHEVVRVTSTSDVSVAAVAPNSPAMLAAAPLSSNADTAEEEECTDADAAVGPSPQELEELALEASLQEAIAALGVDFADAAQDEESPLSDADDADAQPHTAIVAADCSAATSDGESGAAEAATAEATAMVVVVGAEAYCDADDVENQAPVAAATLASPAAKATAGDETRSEALQALSSR